MKFKLRYKNLIFTFKCENELKEHIKKFPVNYEIKIIENGKLYKWNNWQTIENIFNL